MRFETFLIPALRMINRYPWLNRVLFARDPWGNPLQFVQRDFPRF